MTDLRLGDPAFERALRATLDDLAPDAAPDALRAAVAAVPLRAGGGAAGRGRTLFAALGLAAAILVAVAGLALLTRTDAPNGNLTPGGTPSPASPTPSTLTVTYRVVPGDGSTASKAQIDAVGEVMAARLRAFGIGTFSWSASDDRLTFEVPVPAGAGTADAIRSLLGTTGVFSIRQPVVTPPEAGDPVTGTPLVSGDTVSGATVGAGQGTGYGPTLDITIGGDGAAALAGATRAHIGEYLPIALDGIVVTAPVIQAEIPNGQVQISFDSQDPTTAPWLAAILQSGPLPLPVEAVAP